MRFDAFCGPTYTLQSVAADAQRTVNLFPELNETGQGKNKYNFFGTPGVRLFVDLTTLDAAATPVRGLWSGAGRLFVAAGTKLIEVNSAGGVGAGGITTIADDADHSPVQMFANGTQLFVIASGRAYIHDGAVLTAITFPAHSGTVNTNNFDVTWVSGDKFDVAMARETITINAVAYTVDTVAADGTSLTLTADAGVQAGVAYSATPALKAVTGGFLGGYFIAHKWIDGGGAVDANWNRFHISGLWNGASPWDALDYAVKEGNPDNIIGILVDHQYLWLLGAQTTEVWVNTGSADFPFERAAPVIHQGCLSPWSPVSVGGTVGWIGMDARGGPVAYLAEGFQPRRVSTHAVEYAWRMMSPSGAARKANSFAYTQNGHIFWVVNFPGHTTSWVYDLTTNMWHERGVWDPLIAPSGAYGKPLYRYHTFLAEWEEVALFGVTGHIVGGMGSGNLYHLSLDYGDDNGENIRRVRTAPHITSENRNNFYHRLELDCELGGISGPVYTPVGPPGLNDATSGGTYSGTATATFQVEITGASAFRWRKNAGAWTAGVAITGAAQALSDGVTIRFRSTTGHAVGDVWTITASPESSASLSISRNGGRTFGTARAASAVTVGDYGKRVVWRQLGRARDLVPSAVITGKAKVAIFNAYIEASEGNA